MTLRSVLAVGEPVEIFSPWEVVFGFLILLVLVALAVGPLWLLRRRPHRPRLQVFALLVMAAVGVCLLVALLLTP